MLASASVRATDSMSGTRASNARTGWNCTFACIDAMGEGAVATVLQQGCFPAPMLQLPAIFLQQSISACAIFGLGRQASAGVASQIARRASTRMDRHRITTTCYLSGKPPRNLDRSRNTLTVKSFSPWNHGFWYLILLMSWRRVPYLGASAFLLNPSMRLVPVRLFILRLRPVDDGRFITPVQQTRHHLPMRAGKHEGLHRLFCCPQGPSPKCQLSVAQ
jgi:hypothetical protein